MQRFRESGKIYYMPVWTVAELNKLLNGVYAKSRSVQDVRELYRQWGGCVRCVLEYLEKPKQESEKLLEDDVNASSADDLLAACTGYNNDKVIAFPVPFEINILFHVLLWAFCFTVPTKIFQAQATCMTTFLHCKCFLPMYCCMRRCCSERTQCLQVSDRIVHHVPTDDMEFLKEVVLASKHVASRVYRKLASETTHNHVWFLRQSAGDERCMTMRGDLFEEYVVETQSQGGSVKYPCKANSNDFHTPGGPSMNLS